MTDKPKVLITGVGGRSVGFQILHALHQLKELPYDLLVCDADEKAYGLYLEARRYKVPLVSSPDYLDKIVSIIKEERVDLVIPGTEVELRFLAKHKDALGCVLLASDSAVLKTCLDKKKSCEWLSAHNVGLPETAGVDGWEDLTVRCGFPIVAKPSDITGGSRNVEILANAEEVEDYIERFPRSSDAILFQQYVGSAESEYTVGVLMDRDGRVVDSIVLKRILTGLSLGTERVIDGQRYALSTGYSQGMIIKDETIQAFCEGVAESLDVRGPLNVQLRVHTDGTIKVFELHPRFSGTTSIRAQAGFNEVDLAIRSFLNAEVLARQSYRADVYAMRAFQNVIIPAGDVDAVAKQD
jgi:carbamoyl-phosphate synthase large subunit